MFESVNAFYEGAKAAVEVFDRFISDFGLSGLVGSDHICYKVSSAENFEDIKKIFEKDSKWIYQAIISGRRIATIRTNQVLRTSAGGINLVELSDQKPDGSQSDGFDHIEIYPSAVTYSELVSRLREKGLEVREVVRPHHTTHDIKLNSGFIIRLTRDRLVDAIKSEM
ncbi:MAG: VOC family protein [Candidatus Nanoarchaeia archaeon]|nr:VOC family protein [Candidatus Nanoarchaeia archaeon]